MRSDKELLEIILEEFKSQDHIGLCATILASVFIGHITIDEKIRLDDIIEDNKPKEAEPFYWWPEWKKQPRIEFLKQLINKEDEKISKGSI